MSSIAFPREVRLTYKGQFQAVFGNAKSVRNQYFTILVRLTSDETARLGMVVAKKKARRAVDRHRIKRVVRESFRHSRVNLPVADIIVISQPPAARASNDELFRALEQLWKKLRRMTVNDQRTAHN
mgnify:CR=1 FL=1